MIAVEIERRIDRALGRVRQAFRAVLAGVGSSAPVQLAQAAALAGEQLDAVELMQHYGFTSRPLAGTAAVVLPIGGKTSHGVVIATEHGSYRLRNLAAGEVALYTDEGDKVVLKRGRVIEITTQTLRINASTAVEITTPTMTVTAATAVSLTTPLVQASAALKAAGQITDLSASNVKTMSDMRAVYNTHTHHENNGAGDTNGPTQTI